MNPEDLANPEDRLVERIDSRITAVRTSSQDFSFNEIADMYRANELIIQPEFQRMFRWTEGAQSRFIESLLLELPIPPIFLIEREDRIYELIDGLQRVSSYLHFRGELRDSDGQLVDPLVLVDCDIVTELNGFRHEQLPRSLDIKLKRSYVRSEILRKESDPRLRYYMFKRLNTGGAILSEQEVRNATIRLLSNDFNAFLIDLSHNTDFQACIGAIPEPARQRRFDQELVLRFFAFKNDLDTYRHDVADFLTDYMEAVSDTVNARDFSYAAERGIFDKTFLLLRKVAETLEIGERIFGTTSASGEPTRQFSVYHFEGLTLGLQRVLELVDPEADETIEKLAGVVSLGKKDDEFLRHGGAGKNDRIPLRARIEYFASRFESALSA